MELKIATFLRQQQQAAKQTQTKHALLCTNKKGIALQAVLYSAQSLQYDILILILPGPDLHCSMPTWLMLRQQGSSSAASLIFLLTSLLLP